MVNAICYRQRGTMLVLMFAGFIMLCCILPQAVFAQGDGGSLSILEPREGTVYIPGGKIYISLQSSDPRERIKSVAFFITPPESGNPGTPFAIDRERTDGWSAVWPVPLEAREGWYRLTCQGFDRNGVRCGREVRVPVMVKSSPVRLTIGSPPNGQKYSAGEVLQIAGQLIDNGSMVKRVEFYLFPSASPIPAAPDAVLTKLYSGISAKILIPKEPLGNYEAVIKAFSAESAGECIAEGRIRIAVVEPEVSIRIGEPKNGTIFYPGQKVYFYGNLVDKGKRVRQVRLYYGKKDKSVEPLTLAITSSSEVKGNFAVPYDQYGSTPLIVELLDKGGSLLIAHETSITVNKPEVNLAVRVPADGAYYYPGEEVFINAAVEDRATVIEKVSFVIFPRGEPMAATMTHNSRVLGNSCGMVFELPPSAKPGWYVLQVTARDARGIMLIQKNVNFEIRK